MLGKVASYGLDTRGWAIIEAANGQTFFARTPVDYDPADIALDMTVEFTPEYSPDFPVARNVRGCAGGISPCHNRD